MKRLNKFQSSLIIVLSQTFIVIGGMSTSWLSYLFLEQNFVCSNHLTFFEREGFIKIKDDFKIIKKSSIFMEKLKKYF
jgi:hypothetical protein